MRFLVRASLMSAVAIGCAVPANAVASRRSCTIAADLASLAEFRKYPVGSQSHEPWHAPDVRRGRGHLYRSLIRSEGRGPPDFAGRYKVVRAGCGAGMICPLFVDLRTGKVTWVPSLQSIEWSYANAGPMEEATGIADNRLVYRRHSRLLIALGTRNEQNDLSGATLYDWREEGPRLIRFIPQASLCAGGASR